MNDLHRLCRIMGTFDLATGHAETMSDALDALEEELRDILGYFRARREWVELTDEEIDDIKQNAPVYVSAKAVSAIVPMVEDKLKEKNA